MHLKHPIESVIPTGHGPVLEVLSRTNQPLTGRGIGRLLEGRLSQRRIADVLLELTAAGLVNAERAGSASLYRMNRDHLAAEAIIGLADIRAMLIERIQAQIVLWEQAPTAAWLFGSFARHEGDAGSDIDICVLRSDAVAEDNTMWMNQLAELQSRVLAWTGNDLEILEYSEHDFHELVSAEDPLVRSLRSDAVVVAGSRVAAYGGDR